MQLSFMMEYTLPSSKMTLSPNTTTSNSPSEMSLFKIFLLGLLLAFMSSAQTPITPKGAGLAEDL
jgi:hypothetical protein